jgi:aminoglycoside phosphotransferase (APT) family kinase protein
MSPDAAALHSIAAQLHLDTEGFQPLRVHDAAVYLLPRSNIVVRLVRATDTNRERAELALRVTEWLRRHNFPSVRPRYRQPYQAAGTLATLWEYLPQPSTDPPLSVLARALGRLLRDLHALPAPPFRLPTFDPFARLRAAMDGDRVSSVLLADDCAFLDARIVKLEDAFRALDFPLGIGLIHNDAHIGNLLASAGSRCGFVLADWESARWGPREVDLVLEGAPGNRFGESAELRTAFAEAYGYDIAGWVGWRVLRDARDLHSLAAYLRTAPSQPAAAEELRRRLASLKDTRRAYVWRTVD